MTRACIVFATVALLGCPSSEPEPSKSEPAPKPPPAQAAPPAAQTPPAPTPEPEAAPEPSTPEEIELARKAALMDGRDKDAVKYCVMAGIESGKSDPQALLGCALAACRGKDMDKARAWAKNLPKALMAQAKQICQASGAIL